MTASSPDPRRLEDATVHAPWRQQRPRLSWQDAVLPLTFSALVVALAVSSPYFLTVRNIVNVLHQVAILLIVTVGMTWVVISGGFDLSMGANVALSGCVAAVVMLNVGLAGGIVAGLLAGTALGALNGVLIAYGRLSPFIATLGTLVVGRGLALGVTGGGAVFGLPRSFYWLGSGQVVGVPVPVILAGLVFVLGWLILRFHPFGVMLYAVGGNSEAARLSGIRVARVVLLTYVVSGFLAAVAGLALTSRVRAAEPTVAVFLELFSVAAVVLGGARLGGGSGSLPRSTLGVLFIGSLENGLNLLNVPFYWQQVVVGVVFMVAAALTVRVFARSRA